jgi:hypothetical protein
MTRAERMARIRRDLEELKARMQRIEHETFSATRTVTKLQGELLQLEQPEPVAADITAGGSTGRA